MEANNVLRKRKHQYYCPNFQQLSNVLDNFILSTNFSHHAASEDDAEDLQEGNGQSNSTNQDQFSFNEILELLFASNSVEIAGCVCARSICLVGLATTCRNGRIARCAVSPVNLTINSTAFELQNEIRICSYISYINIVKQGQIPTCKFLTKNYYTKLLLS